MSELPKHIYNEKNGLHYTLYGDYYFLEGLVRFRNLMKDAR